MLRYPTRENASHGNQKRRPAVGGSLEGAAGSAALPLAGPNPRKSMQCPTSATKVTCPKVASPKVARPPRSRAPR